jgi:hypothetical protein
MILHTLQPRFDTKTGKPTDPAMAWSGWICDFCGKLHGPDSEIALDNIKYSISENDSVEPFYHEMRIKGFEKIHIYSVFNNHPHFQYCAPWNGDKYCEHVMLKAYAKANKTNPRMTLCVMMYDARVQMLAQLLKAGTYTLEELKLDER